jgi:hypothetical protein
MSVYLHPFLSYPACKSHLFSTVLYWHLWSVQLYHIFPHYLIHGLIFVGEKKILNLNVCFYFLYNFL